MGGVMPLLLQAAAAGLRIRVDGDRLVVRGPHAAEDIARQLLAHKAQVIAALAEPDELRLHAAQIIFGASPDS